MDAKDVREEIATRLRTIDGLNVSAWPIPTPIPPVAVVVPQGVTYDQTYGRRSDQMNYQVLVFIGKVNDRSSSDRLDEYVSGSGDRSIKQALEVVPTYVNLAVNPRATAYDTPGGPRWQDDRFEPANYSLLTGITGPDGTDLTTAARFTVTTGRAHHGFHLAGNPELSSPEATGLATVKGGATYAISLYLRYTGVTSQTYQIRARFANDGTWIDLPANVGSPTSLPTGEWVRLSGTITAPANAERMSLIVRAVGATDQVNDTIDGTGLMVTETSTVLDYRDGTSAGWRWLGTADAAASIGPERIPVFDSIHVASGEWDVVSVNGNEYLTAIFDLTVIGRGG